MWGCHLGEINIKSRRINIEAGVQLDAQHSYGTGRKAKEFVTEEVKGMRKGKISRFAISEWASPTVIVAKPDKW